MITLWIAAALMAALSAGLVMYRAARSSRSAAEPDPAMAIYRRQLSEIDDLAARGLMAEDERRAARAETGRRLLAQADSGQTGAGSAVALAKPIRPLVMMLVAAVPALAAVGLYFVVGQPALPDLPFKARLAQWQAHPDQAPPEGLGALLNELARRRPKDAEPLVQLARLDLQLGDNAGAAHALRRAALIAPNRPDVWAVLAEVQILQAQGQVDAQAEASLRKVVALDPGNDTARYYLARARILRGETAAGLADWRALDAALPAGDPRRPALEADIAAVEKTGKPVPPAAPAAEAQAQAGQGDPSAMIHQMVDGLAARLKTNPDDPAGWVRLVRAYTVLGETDKRDAALAEARRRYAARPEVLSQLNAALTPPR
jgi:cytochrome c-type biogenesis protein CcmH